MLHSNKDGAAKDHGKKFGSELAASSGRIAHSLKPQHRENMFEYIYYDYVLSISATLHSTPAIAARGH